MIWDTSGCLANICNSCEGFEWWNSRDSGSRHSGARWRRAHCKNAVLTVLEGQPSSTWRFKRGTPGEAGNGAAKTSRSVQCRDHVAEWRSVVSPESWRRPPFIFLNRLLSSFKFYQGTQPWHVFFGTGVVKDSQSKITTIYFWTRNTLQEGRQPRAEQTQKRRFQRAAKVVSCFELRPFYSSQAPGTLKIER